ncbi:MAG: VUT family protein [Acidimicrobiales bacterium]
MDQLRQSKINPLTLAVGVGCFVAFLVAVPFANWWLRENGLWIAPVLGPLPSALWVVGITFVLRDLIQLTIGRRWAWLAILAGTVLSFWLASPSLALASGVAFLASESIDAAIFTPIANRGRFLLAVTISGYCAGFLDSALFLRIAFDDWSGWWQLGIAKAIVIAIVTPFAWALRLLIRRRLPT